MKFAMFGLAVVALLFITPSAHAAIFNCNPADVASWGNRVHVRCSPSAGVIAFFAVNTTNPGATERFTEIALAALVNNKTLAIEFNPADASGPSFGCALSNCRPALAIVIVK